MLLGGRNQLGVSSTQRRASQRRCARDNWSHHTLGTWLPVPRLVLKNRTLHKGRSRRNMPTRRSVGTCYRGCAQARAPRSTSWQTWMVCAC